MAMTWPSRSNSRALRGGASGSRGGVGRGDAGGLSGAELFAVGLDVGRTRSEGEGSGAPTAVAGAREGAGDGPLPVPNGWAVLGGRPSSATSTSAATATTAIAATPTPGP